MNAITDIENRAKAYSEARTKVAEYVAELQSGIDALNRMHLPKLKRAVNRAAELAQQLRDQVAEAPELFEKPRTAIFHGIKVGFEKGKGAVDFDDDDRVVALIKKKLPDQADVLIKTTEKPVKSALKQLSVKELQSIGCTVEETGDQVVVRAVDRDVDKLVNALLKGATEDAET